MTTSGNGYLLETTDVSKTYGAVTALRSATLQVRPGEVHALMGANGAGKSTLVKILTGGVRPDGGTIEVRGSARRAHSPAQARQGGVVSVYQEPSLIPDLDIVSNLRLTRTPVEPFREWVRRLGLGELDLTLMARDLPLASLRIIDLARALASEPDVLMLDEMTAALPADLTENVLEVIKEFQGSDRCVVFISHRMTEIAAVCDRATVLREGETVGVVDVADPDSADRIVELMLGEIIEDLGDSEELLARGINTTDSHPRLEVQNLGAATRLRDVSFAVHPGEVVGLVALESQGQEQLFDILAGSERATKGSMLVEGKPVTFRHPADAIREGIVFVPADRAEALLMQRSVRENIALPFSVRFPRWGPLRRREEKPKVDDAVSRLQIDTRAQREVRFLSGGNQQKVTIARWVAGGLKTLLCFDPTRGIDIRTKHQIYPLLRELAAAGAAVLLYTSELNEIQLACDRVLVMFNGEIVTEMHVSEADEETLLRAAHNLQPDSAVPGEGSPR